MSMGENEMVNRYAIVEDGDDSIIYEVQLEPPTRWGLRDDLRPRVLIRHTPPGTAGSSNPWASAGRGRAALPGGASSG